MLNESQLNRLFQYAMAVTQQRADALDLLQSTVEKYLIEIQRGRVIENPEAFTRKTLRNKFIDQRRFQNRWQAEPYEAAEVYDISPLNIEDYVVNGQLVEAVWAQLDANGRDILYHWAVLGYTTEEVSQELDIPHGSVLSKLHRIRQRLQATELKGSAS